MYTVPNRLYGVQYGDLSTTSVSSGWPSASHSQDRVWRHYYDIHRNGVRTPVIRITGKEVAPSISVENPSNPSTPFNGLLFRELATMNGRTIRGYLSKWELALLLCAVISTGARLVCNPVRPKRAPGKEINFVPILSRRIMLLPISTWRVVNWPYSCQQYVLESS